MKVRAHGDMRSKTIWSATRLASPQLVRLTYTWHRTGAKRLLSYGTGHQRVEKWSAE